MPNFEAFKRAQRRFREHGALGLIKAGAAKVKSICKEYWILTLCVSIVVILAWAGLVDRYLASDHFQYWVAIVSGNYSAPSSAQKELFGPLEYGFSVILAVLINATPLVGVLILVSRYLNALVITEQEQAMQLQSLLTLVETLAKSELLNQFGQSEEIFQKIGSAFEMVDQKTVPYIKEVYGDKAASAYSELLHQELSPS